MRLKLLLILEYLKERLRIIKNGLLTTKQDLLPSYNGDKYFLKIRLHCSSQEIGWQVEHWLHR